MQITSIGEFELIRRITNLNKNNNKNKNILVGIGDDCAVVKFGRKNLCITTDSLVDNVHFSKKWFTPEQIGMKAIEVNVSDVAAIGGIPKYALISLVLKESESVEFLDVVYSGIYKTAEKYRIEIIGGNTSHGSQNVIDVTMLGEVKNPVTRAGANVGDLIFVTGELGRAAVGLRLFQKSISGFDSLKKSFLEPMAQLDKSRLFSEYASSMIDISDGLSSDLGHICEQSKVGAVIHKPQIPISMETKQAASVLGIDVFELALSGGDDYQLLFTVPRKFSPRIKGAYHIGEIVNGKDIILESKDRKEKIKKRGYNHFAKL